MRRLATDWETIFSKLISNKGYESKICKGILKLNKNTSNYGSNNKKWAKGLNIHLINEDIQMSNKQEKCSTSRHQGTAN